MKENKRYNIWSFVFGFVITVIIFGFLFLAAMFTGCTSQPSKAAGIYSAEITTQTIQEKLEWQEQVILAYNRLLHEVWLDRPTYVEECLCEGDAYTHLDELFNGEWGDTFQFHSVEDSLRYNMNWDSTPVYRIKKIVVHTEEE